MNSLALRREAHPDSARCGVSLWSAPHSVATMARVHGAPPISRTSGGKNHMIQTEPCPVKSDGSAHRCFDCSQPIAAGAPVLDFGRHGYRHHPSCDGVTSPAAAGAELDAGDLVARAMGLMPSESTPAAQHAWAASKTPARPAASKSNMDRVCEAMGLRPTSETQSKE